jgi:hypothetical protein
MLNSNFQQLVVVFFVIILISLIACGIYCRHKLQSYKGTGRVADIEQWSVKETISWIVTFGITIGLIIHIV